MDTLNMICIAAAITVIVLAVTAIVVVLQRTRKILDNIDDMILSGMEGTFSEHTFDESALSSVESRMRRFLSDYMVSFEKLEREKDNIKTLISDISHQTKTPIANIHLYSQLLLEYPLPEESIECVNALSIQTEKLKFLISALIKTSRLETGIITVASKETSVGWLLEEVEQQIKPKAAAKNIAVSVQATNDLAFFDLKWTSEALYNILDNAVKYAPNGTTITVIPRSYELFYRIDITDEGIGISPNEMSKIFTRFYRSPAVRDQEGVGIGLFLTRQIISAEGGYIKASSKLGKGSTFSVFLPYKILNK